MFFQQALINMGIFDRKSITKTIKTTEGFYFGKSESEGESSYKKSSNTLFDDYLDILPKIGDGCFIITGRKGSGKSGRDGKALRRDRGGKVHRLAHPRPLSGVWGQEGPCGAESGGAHALDRRAERA